MKKKLIFKILLLIVSNLLFSQEALKSIEEEYYDFLSLDGTIERPTLSYRTLSDSEWYIPDNKEHIWQNNNLGNTNILFESTNQGTNWFTKGFYHGLKYKIYGPEWYNSYNTKNPYGQNDGALWQGKGYNTSFSVGARLEGYGFELTLKPQFTFSQNLEFEYVKPNYDNNNSLYNNKAGIFGYYGIAFIDAPQRFGNKSFFTFDFGDSEIRYNWNSFTLGFGTQYIWLGPARINPIIHSNNAPSYPKIDIGMRKQKISIKQFELGELEFRCWWGQLTESDYFDNDNSNNHNLISALSISWSLPGIFKGLTFGFNRNMLSKWDNINKYTLFEIYLPWMNSKAGVDESDQRASFTINYLIPKVGFEIYFEWARNDFQVKELNLIRYPFHTQAWNIGVVKSLNFKNKLKGKLTFEYTYLECSHDYNTTYPWVSTFYAHHKITQGYTNKGQWLGAGIGTGGNSQYLEFELIYPKGKSSIYLYRFNPDLDFVWFNSDFENSYANKMKTILTLGIDTNNYLTQSFILMNQIDFILNMSNNYSYQGKQLEFSIKVSCKYIF